MVPYWGDKVNYSIWLSYWPASLCVYSMDPLHKICWKNGKICQKGFLKLIFESILKNFASRLWNWTFLFDNFLVLGLVRCQGWVVMSKKMWKNSKITAFYYRCRCFIILYSDCLVTLMPRNISLGAVEGGGGDKELGPLLLLNSLWVGVVRCEGCGGVGRGGGGWGEEEWVAIHPQQWTWNINTPAFVLLTICLCLNGRALQNALYTYCTLHLIIFRGWIHVMSLGGRGGPSLVFLLW